MRETFNNSQTSSVSNVKELICCGKGIVSGVAGVGGVVNMGVRAGRATAVATAADVAALGGTAVRLGGRLFMGGVIGLGVFALGFSLNDVIKGSLELHRETKSKAGDYLRELAHRLDTFVTTGT